MPRTSRPGPHGAATARNLPPAAALPLLGCLLCWAASLDSARGEIVLSGQGPNSTNAPKPGVAVPSPTGEAQADRFDLLEFLSGDKLRGTLYSIDDTHGVRWRHPSIKQVLEIDPASIASIKLDRPHSTNQAPGQTCLIHLTNEDQLLGELLALDGTNISLRTWYAGILTIPRNRTRSISPGQAVSTAIFEGPESLDGWKRSNSTRFRQVGESSSGWAFRNGAFYCAGGGSIGRDVKLPPLSSIEFDLAWSGYLNLGVSFYTEKLENYGGDCYLLQFSSGSIYLQRMSKEGNSSNLGHSEASMLARKSKTSVAIRSNQEQKIISLFIDGNVVKQWTDRSDFSPGTGLAFFHQGQGAIRVSNIRVTEWDGKLNQDTQSDPTSEEDLVKLANNDQITGSLEIIRDGKMKFGTEFATLDVPLERIATIQLASDKSETAQAPAGAIRAAFTRRGHVTFQIKRWDDRQILGHSPDLGQVKFVPSAFSRIDFNLDQQQSDPDLLDLTGIDAIPFPSID